MGLSIRGVAIKVMPIGVSYGRGHGGVSKRGVSLGGVATGGVAAEGVAIGESIVSIGVNWGRGHRDVSIGVKGSVVGVSMGGVSPGVSLAPPDPCDPPVTPL